MCCLRSPRFLRSSQVRFSLSFLIPRLWKLRQFLGLQYAYLKAPKNMRSLVMAIFLFISSIAAALNEAFTTISLDPYLIWNYGSMGVIAAVGGTLFWISVRKLDADEDRLNNLAEGHLDEKK